MLDLDFSADQFVIDNLEEVTVTSARTAGDEAATVVNAAYYPSPVAEGAPSYGVYTKGRAKFSIVEDELEDIDGIKPRDTIERDNGDVYTVLTAESGIITRVYQIEAICLKIAADLRQTATLTRPTNAQDSAGRASLASYTTVNATIYCRLQPTDNRAGDVLDRRTMPNTAIAYLDRQVDARAKDVFTVDGEKWSVVGGRNPERLDELMSLELEQIL